MRRWIRLGGTITSLTQGVAVFPCQIPVTPDGRAFAEPGRPLPLAQRTQRCDHPTDVLVGRAPTCAHHLAELPAVDGAITLAQLTQGLTLEACP